MSILGNNLLAQYYAQNQGLPFGYEAVEYLESSGSQYIDSGVECTSQLIVSFKGQSLTDVNAACCGGINSELSPILFRHHWSISAKSFSYWCQYGQVALASIRPTVDSVVDVHTGYINPVLGNAIVDGSLITFAPIQHFYTTGKNYGIFGRISNTGIIQSRPCRFFLFQMELNNNKVRDFIPCIRKSDNKPGMYDLCKSICPLTGTPFYINAGTSEFVTP